MPAKARWRRLAGGLSADVTVAEAWSGDVVVCKVASHDQANLLFRSDPGVEAIAMDTLDPSAARPLAVLRDGPRRAIIYPFARKVRPIAAHELALALSKVHARSSTRVRGRHGNPRGLPARPLFHPGLVKAGRKHLCAGILDTEEVGCLDRHLSRLPLAQEGTARPVHGDPTMANAFVGPDGPVLIDWQSCHLGDPTHDLAIATSPAMKAVHGTPGDDDGGEALLAAYPDAAVVDHFRHLAVCFHVQMIGHCLWRIARGHAAFRIGLAAEVAALRDRLGGAISQPPR